jgi:serine/threonine protein kinase, bacterial
VDGTGSAASFALPHGIAVDASGNLFVADTYNNKIRKVTSAQVVTTLAGNAANGAGWADGSGSAASFNGPYGIAVDGNGNIFVADYANNKIRKLTAAGVVTTIAGNSANNPGSADGIGSAAGFNSPAGIAVDGNGTLYVADTYNNKIRKISLQ